MDAFFDYFAFTVSVSHDDFDKPLSVALGLISSVLEQTYEEKTGLYFYSYTARWNGALVAWGGEHQKNTLLVSITGTGCRHFTYDDLRHLVVALSEYGEIHPKRFDVAVDVAGFATYHHIKRFSESFFISNRVERFDHHENENYKTGEFISGTMYFGSRTSPRMTRIYTKIRQDDAHVTRIEIECKEGWAQRVFELFMQSKEPSCIMLSLARDYLALDLYVSTDNIVPVEITYPKRERIKAVAVWLLQNVAGCVEDIRQVYGDRFLYDLAMAGWFKRNGKKKIKDRAPGTPSSNTGVQSQLFEIEYHLTDSGADILNGVMEHFESE